AADFHRAACFQTVDFAEFRLELVARRAAELRGSVEKETEADSNGQNGGTHGGFYNVSFHVISPWFSVLCGQRRRGLVIFIRAASMRCNRPCWRRAGHLSARGRADGKRHRYPSYW